MSASHVKQRKTETFCRHCQRAPCKRDSGVSCHAIYMRLWRAKKRNELEQLRQEDRSRRMREIAERLDRSRRPT